jgi:hypothetical protein
MSIQPGLNQSVAPRLNQSVQAGFSQGTQPMLNQSVQAAFNQGVRMQAATIPQPIPQSAAGQVVMPASFPATRAAPPASYRNPAAWGSNLGPYYWDTNTLKWQTNRTAWRGGLKASPNLPPGP